MHLPIPFSKTKSYDDLFLEHYEWLSKWALQLTDGHQDEADDLVHDFYLQLIQSHPTLDQNDCDRVRGYFYRMLRNLSVSNARRASRNVLNSLSIADYDCLDFGLAALDRSQLIFVRSDLVGVCQYACGRRHRSRAASILILRFFLGFDSGETSRILRTGRNAVEKSLQQARHEARAYLRKPGNPRFLIREPLSTSSGSWSTTHLPDNPIALFKDLRDRILADTTGRCSGEEVLEQQYRHANVEMRTSELAHVVSCQCCLDRISQVLGIPPLSERAPSDGTPHDREGGGSSGNPRGSSPNLKTLKQKRRQMFDHSPQKLQIAVDGDIRAAYDVSSTRNQLEVQLDPLTAPSFLEVFSEQGVRLLYLQIEDDTQAEPRPCLAVAELSHGRFLELELVRTRGIAVASATYQDPSTEFAIIEQAEPRVAPTPSSAPSPRLKFWFRKLASAGMDSFRHCSGRLSSFTPLAIALGAAAALLLFIRCFPTGVRTVSVRPISAATLLERSRSAEQTHIPSGGAVHAVFSLQTFSDEGKLLAAQTVDRWTSLDPDRAALRLVNHDGRTTAGRWRNRSRVTVYSHKKTTRSRTGSPAGVATFETAWEQVPGADALETWPAIQNSANVTEDPSGYDIRYQRPSQDSPGVVSASLVLDGASLEPVREDIRIREAHETREYRFERLSYVVTPHNLVHDSDFALPPDLASTVRLPDAGKAGLNNAAQMLDALGILDRLDPALAPFVDVERSANGVISVSGVLPTNDQRDAVKRQFLSLRDQGKLLLALHSSQEEATPAAATSQPIVIVESAPVPVDDAQIPFHAEIKAMLSSQGIGAPALDEEIDQLANKAVADIKAVHRDAWDVQQIAANDFSIQELGSLRPQDKIRWLLLLRRHTRQLDDQLADLVLNLPFLKLPPSPTRPPAEDQPPLLTSTIRLAADTGELLDECDRLDSQLTADLTISALPNRTESNGRDIATLLATVRARERLLSGTVETLLAQAPARQ